MPDTALQVDQIASAIVVVRGHRVLLDEDLARLYGVETKVLNQAVRRNKARFPEDFMFQLSAEEHAGLRSQFVTLDEGRGRYRKFWPLAFQELVAWLQDNRLTVDAGTFDVTTPPSGIPTDFPELVGVATDRGTRIDPGSGFTIAACGASCYDMSIKSQKCDILGRHVVGGDI